MANAQDVLDLHVDIVFIANSIRKTLEISAYIKDVLQDCQSLKI